MKSYLAFDIGATKTAWGTFNKKGELQKTGRFPTADNQAELLAELGKVIKAYPSFTVGVGIAGTINREHTSIEVCGNLSHLHQWPLARLLEEQFGVAATLDNDARCALIGEVWQGAATQLKNVVMITIGTGVGGALMENGIIQAHPEDLSHEMGHILIDPDDLFPARSGSGTLEALLGGRNIEERFHISLEEMSKRVRINDKEAITFWKQISYFFIQSMKAIHRLYACDVIIVGGAGAQNLAYYLQDEPPCPVIPAQLGAEAGLYGAARLAIHLQEDLDSKA